MSVPAGIDSALLYQLDAMPEATDEGVTVTIPRAAFRELMGAWHRCDLLARDVAALIKERDSLVRAVAKLAVLP